MGTRERGRRGGILVSQEDFWDVLGCDDEAGDSDSDSAFGNKATYATRILRASLALSRTNRTGP